MSEINDSRWDYPTVLPTNSYVVINEVELVSISQPTTYTAKSKRLLKIKLAKAGLVLDDCQIA